MISRYTNEEMGKIWSQGNKFKKWLDIEIAAVEAWSELGVVPKQAVEVIKEKADFDINRIDEIEKEVKHDVIAFLTSVAEYVGPESRFIHYGMTSSDILDTGLSLQMVEASDILLKKLVKLEKIFRDKAREYKGVVMMGRSHGVHAEPTTFGLKMALFFSETSRNIDRLKKAIDSISVGQISGPVGTYSNVDPVIEESVCKKLKLRPALVSTQVIQRDRHAELLITLAVIGSSLEKFATEVRGLQKTEVREVEEYFSKGQKGSSAMPHKRNPITCERIAGLSRVLRGNSLAAMENIALWHERDITHSSVERIIIPDSTILLDYMLDKTIDVFKNLIIYPENMKKNLGLMRGIFYSQTVMLKLIDKGLTREESYKLVQACAMDVWKDDDNDLQKMIKKSEGITNLLTNQEIDECFDLERLLRNENKIYERIGL